MDVGFSGWMKVSAVMEEALLNSIAVVGLSSNDNGATDTKARLAYFSFDTLGPVRHNLRICVRVRWCGWPHF